MRGHVYNVPRGLVWDMLWISQRERERERRNRAEEGERELRAAQCVRRSFAVDCGLRKLPFQKWFLSSLMLP